MLSSKCFFHNNPFHLSDNNRERLNLFFYLWILLLLPTESDGVVVTESDFLALQAFKQELLDPKGFLRSWNESGYGACSIPITLTHSDSITFLDFQHNNLSGSVPTQLANRFNSSSFVGNIHLCGYSLSTRCPSPAASFGVIASPPKLSQQHHHRKLSTKDIILIVAGVLLIVLVTLCCIMLIRLIRNRATSKASNGSVDTRTGKGVPPVVGVGEGGGKLVHFDGPMAFTTDDLLCATTEIIGKSTYGTVYKATLEDRSEVAVKRLREKITKSVREFESEVSVLGKIKHPNILALRAYYLGPKGEKLLIFDYMPKGSLASFLHVCGPETTIDWATRMKIAHGVARGMFYLHSQENIVHGHLTSSNVLLDENTNAKIADFGLSRLMTSAANSSAHQSY